MTDIEKIQAQVELLENNISLLIQEFMKHNGHCDLDINVENQWAVTQDGKRELIRTNVYVGIRL